MNRAINPLCFLTIVFSSIVVISHAQYHSGEVIIELTGSTIGRTVPFDFSEIDDFCSFFGNNLCSVSIADAEIVISKTNFDTLSSSYGVLDLGIFDTSGLAQLGKVPLGGYINKTAIQLHHIYAIKTSEGHYGAIFYKELIIGGNNLNVYRWAYQENGSNDLTLPGLNKRDRKNKVNITNKGEVLKKIIIQNNKNPILNGFTTYNLLGKKYENQCGFFFISSGMLLVPR